MPTERIAIFVDGAAMFYAQRENGWHIDYRNVFHYFTDNRELSGAWYFTAIPPAGDPDAVNRYKKFKYALTQIGFRVKDKEVRVLYDKNTGVAKLKGNLDIELVFRMLSAVETYDTVVLLGGDSDYLPVIEHLVNLGKKIIIVGRKGSTANDLINASTSFVDLNSIRDRISKTK